MKTVSILLATAARYQSIAGLEIELVLCRALCSGIVGFLHEGLKVISAQDLSVEEIACHWQGAAQCILRVESERTSSGAAKQSK